MVQNVAVLVYVSQPKMLGKSVYKDIHNPFIHGDTISCQKSKCWHIKNWHIKLLKSLVYILVDIIFASVRVVVIIANILNIYIYIPTQLFNKGSFNVCIKLHRVIYIRDIGEFNVHVKLIQFNLTCSISQNHTFNFKSWFSLHLMPWKYYI